MPLLRISHQPKMTSLATLLASCAFFVGCGGGGGDSAGPTSGSQSVMPSVPASGSVTVAQADTASAPASAASAIAESAAASEPTAEAAAAKSGDSAAPKPAPAPPPAAATAAPKPTAPPTAVAPTPAPAPAPTGSTATTSSQTGTTASVVTNQAAGTAATTAELNTAAAVTAAQAAATLQARTDRLKAAIDSMKASQHEVKPACSPCSGWGNKPLIVMGAEPYGTSIPSNWPGTRFDQWKAILPWFVIYEGVGGNHASNSAVEINGIEIWAFSIKDRAWRKINSAPLPTWSGSYHVDAAAKSAVQGFASMSAATASFAPTSSLIVHGGLGQVPTPWNASTGKDDVGALYVSTRHRLVVKNAKLPDDRDKANLTINVGADYYPWLGSQLADLNATYVPGSGLGLFQKVTTQWRYASFFVAKQSVTPEQILKATPPLFAY